MKTRGIKVLKKSDLILVLVLAAVTLILWAAAAFFHGDGSVVSVSVDGTAVCEFPLDQDIEYTISGFDGGTNKLVIKDGQAYLTDASCPDKLCMHMGRISKTGQSIICLPNRVVVEIKSRSSGDYDAVTG